MSNGTTLDKSDSTNSKKAENISGDEEKKEGKSCPESEETVTESRKKLLEKAKSANGKTVGEIDIDHYLTNPHNKGDVGQIVQIYLGKMPDNSPDPDFPDAKLELKVTGLKRYKKTGDFHAKERLTLNMIDFQTDHDVSFENSHLLFKCNTMLITCYEYLEKSKGQKADIANFPIVDSFIYELSPEDRMLIEEDYNTILSKINNGKAETLSQSDTQYLEAAPKSSKKSPKFTAQYNSKVLAEKRAFALKPSFLSTIIRRYIYKNKYDSIVALLGGKEKPTIESAILGKLTPWYNKTEKELFSSFPDVKNNKGRFAMFVSRMVGTKDLKKTEEFSKANIQIKTVRIEENGTIREHMSFPAFDFEEVASTPWAESRWYTYFEGAKLLLIVFRKRKGEYYFEKALFYNLPDEVTDYFIRDCYEHTRQILLSGNIVNHVGTITSKSGRVSKQYFTNFTKLSENHVSHVRPKAADFSTYQKPLPVADKLTGMTQYESQCFWLDKGFIAAILSNTDKEYLDEARQAIEKNKL